MSNELKLKLQADSLVQTWREYCNIHTDILELTQDEYLALLENDTDTIESLLSRKQELLKLVKELDVQRQSYLAELAPEQNLVKTNDIIVYLNEYQLQEHSQALRGYNEILISVIEKIQAQNKKNQFYLNKALISLQNLKDSFDNRSGFKVYGKNGTVGHNLNR